MKTLDFTQVDVFSSRKLEGNPLAVFASGQGLSTALMQAIAREMNLSETTFIFPGGRGFEARVRIFTVSAELPFAGHPTLGTAFVLAALRPEQTEVRLKTKVGVIPVRVSRDRRGSYLEMRQNDPVFGSAVESQELAEALGLRLQDLDARYPQQVVSTGTPFLIVPLKRRAALEELAPDYRRLRPILKRVGVRYPYYLVTGEGEFEARMFMETFEDPATGSAAGCATAYLVRHGRQTPDRRFVIRQGRLVRRPSTIFARAALQGDGVTDVRIGGYVVEALRGRLTL
jgi:trans-2,3-dihydro-3-hydroxyanthranilate isomerase